ncbi:hypothetical protein [Hymenobacter polaris]|nr:hypothetical protein [Hymenobacter polaris]
MADDAIKQDKQKGHPRVAFSIMQGFSIQRLRSQLATGKRIREIS